jgi:hypothetical protein
MQEQWKSAYPGVTGTLLTYAMYFMGRSPEQGSFSALYVYLHWQSNRSLTSFFRYAATSPEIEEKGWNGYYFTDPVSMIPI